MPESKIRVLLIEDALADVQLIERMLAKSKLPVFEVTAAGDLAAALKALASNSFDVLLVDLGLPDSTGPATVKRLRAATTLPMIVLTVADSPQTVLDSIKLGARDYFVKSRLDPDELMDKIIDAVVWRQVHEGGPLAEAVANRIGGRTVRLLVVEDQPADVALLKRMLASVKLIRFTFSEVSTLEAAKSHLGHVDIVLLDLNLPDSAGLDTLRTLRAYDAVVPVVLLTGVHDRDISVAALREGAQDYLVKDQIDAPILGRALFRQLKRPNS